MQHRATSTQNFYRRKLPSSCINFASSEGKKLFIESLVKGHANIYFRLASHFLTQDEPSYCGLSTLVMVLNALEVDPGRVWKSPWRFYHESMLDCCVPLDDIKKTGITLSQFACLAECNKLYTEVKYANSKSEFLNILRENVKQCMAVDDTILVVSYNRQVLGQTGAGHFSPLGAYHEESDQILIMDVARFKYPPHWVPLTILRDAMLSIDTTTGKPRGYLLLKLRSHVQQLALLRLQGDISAYKTLLAPRLKEWEQFLAEEALSNQELEFETVCAVFTAIFMGYIVFHDFSEAYQIMQAEGKCHNNCSDMQLMKQTNSCDHICRKILSLDTASYITSTGVCVLLLAWPLQETLSERVRILKRRLENDLSKLDEKSLEKIMTIRHQIEQISNTCKNDIVESSSS
ncbi:Phytochelatin synthase family protein [Brugia malayi]|uniref:glutathione gamma-glutamylcysteinyltransferase n=2 Tax=Brugia malayi TaxID=6279 RepID=A0A0H5S500_BRUMA|nr:Phytochelatin synthase family protein [Brugia malayi]CRZ23776.1 BMA-PCS-1 [Brugia malayi]VIO94743.1 Phytochelatin synthase family protein [Brugia malayi]